MIGVLDGFMKQLNETNQYKGFDRTEADCKSLIKIADKELNDHYERKYPRTSKKTSGGFNPNRDTYKSGVSEGGKIRLHKPVSGQEGFRGGLLTS